MRRSKHNTRKAGAGFSLLDAMVATAVLALGVSASVSLQLQAVRATRLSAEQGLAMSLAADLAERLRASPEPDPGQEAPSFPDWETRLAASLPQARALVCRDDAPWDAAAAAYRWNCSSTPEAALLIKLGWLGMGSAPALVLAVDGGH